MKAFRLMFIICYLFGFLFNVTITLASPPPSEVEERKNEASLHLIGTVTADVLFKDITSDEQYPQQLRKMNLEVDKLIKIPETEKEKTSLEVYYSYIPSWQASEYAGGERMDIAVGDVIEIWLEQGEYGWEPALGGNTVEHLKYIKNRNEPISEPILHAFERMSSAFLKQYTEIFVLVVLSLILVLIGVKALKKN